MNRRHFIISASGVAAALANLSQGAGPAGAKLRVAIIGHTGRGNYGHELDRPWNRLAETEIVAVADPDPAGLAKAQGRMKGAQAFPDYHQMLRQVRLDIAVVCPRHIDQHHAMAMAAIEAGAKAVYLEKPMCRTLAEADQVVQACERRGVTCAVAHRNRYHPTIPVVQKLVQAGAIGRLLEVRGRGKEDARGGASDLWVLGAHVLNVAVVFTGRPRTAAAILLQGDRPVVRSDLLEGSDAIGLVGGDALHVRFETEGKVPLFFDSVKDAGDRESGFGLQLVGTQGIIDFRLDQHPVAHLMRGNPFTPSREPRAWTPITSAGVGQPEPIANIVELVRDHVAPARDLVAALREHRAPLCSVQDGRLVLEMIMATFESHRRGGASVSFPIDAPTNPLGRL